MTKRLLLALLLLSVASRAWGAIAVDATSHSDGATGSSLTFSHTVTGSNTYIVCTAGNRQVGPVDVSTVTYNGGSLAQLGATGAFGTFNKTELWSGIPNATGAHNVVITWASSTANLEGGCVSFTGVDQSTPTGTTVTNTGAGTTATVTITSASGEMVVDGVYEDSSFDLTANQTLQWNDNGNLVSTNAGQQTAAGAASVVMSWGIASSRDWGTIGVPLKPVAAASAVRHRVIQQ